MVSTLFKQSTQFWKGSSDFFIQTLSEECSSDKPKWIGYGKLIFHDIIVLVTGMGIVPFIGWKPCHDKQRKTNKHIGCQDIPANWEHFNTMREFRMRDWRGIQYFLRFLDSEILRLTEKAVRYKETYEKNMHLEKLKDRESRRLK